MAQAKYAAKRLHKMGYKVAAIDQRDTGVVLTVPFGSRVFLVKSLADLSFFKRYAVKASHA